MSGRWSKKKIEMHMETLFTITKTKRTWMENEENTPRVSRIMHSRQ